MSRTVSATNGAATDGAAIDGAAIDGAAIDGAAIDGAAIDDPATQSDDRGSASASPAQTGVLIVDDQAPFRSAARTLISLLRGWTVLGECETGEEAVQIAATLRPDVVLMDINLPGRNGIRSTQDLLAVHPSAAVVLVSTYAAADLPEETDTCGAVGYLRKEELTPRILRELVGGRPIAPTA